MRRSTWSLALPLVLAGLATAQPPAGKLEKLWADLADANETKATRAALALAATPQDTVPFLAKMLRPVKLDAPRLRALLKDLDSDDFDTRDRAYQDLEYYGKTIRADLEKVLETKPSAEVRNQVQRLIEASRTEDELPKAEPPKIQGRSVGVQNVGGNVRIIIDGKPIDLTPKVIAKPGPKPAWLRAARAAAILEHIATPEARDLLGGLAAGADDALPTRSAKEALERLNR